MRIKEAIHISVGDGQGSLACCSPWDCRVRHNWATELNWCTFHVNIFHLSQCISIKYHKSNNYLTLFWGNCCYSNNAHISIIGKYKTIQVFLDATLSYHDIYFWERSEEEIVHSLSLSSSLCIVSIYGREIFWKKS